jgi:hypothetical protein
LSDSAVVAELSRSKLGERTLATLARGNWNSPDVLLVECGHLRVVVKDFAPRSRFLRSTFGRWQIRRELEIYRALEGHPAVPRLLGRLDRFALVIEHRPGARFSLRRPWLFSPRFNSQLREAVAGLHERGVVHLDLAHRSNVLAAPDGRPVLIDFDGSLRFRRGSWARRWLFPLACRIDERALAKWERRVARGSAQSPSAVLADGTLSETGRGASRPM